MTTAWRTVAEMQTRDLVRRRGALLLLVMLPMTWYVAEVASGVAYAVGTGVLAIAWSTATAPLFAVLGARHVDQRLVQSGYRPRDLVAGRLMSLLGTSTVLAGFFGVVMVIGSRPARAGDVFLALLLTAVVSTPIGWLTGALVPRELEGTLLLIGLVGLQVSIPTNAPDLRTAPPHRCRGSADRPTLAHHPRFHLGGAHRDRGHRRVAPPRAHPRCGNVDRVRLLVLGGTRFVGRAVVAEAVGRGWSVTTFNRGVTGFEPVGVEALRGDRLAAADLSIVDGRRWDAVVDTWSGAPGAVAGSARVLAGSADTYVFVSSRSVYRQPREAGMTEEAPVKEPAEDGELGAMKVGAELAVRQHFEARALIARTGLVLGPHEDVGRLPWWLTKVAAGGDVRAPGPEDLPLQYVDARDLAAWLLDSVGTAAVGDVQRAQPPGAHDHG